MRGLAVTLLFFILLVSGVGTLLASSETGAQDIESRLKRFGPSSAGSIERRDVLLDIDELFMNDSLDPLRTVLSEMMSTALWEISSSSISPSIWYIWNMGYVLKVGNHVIGFDLPEILLAPLNDEQKKILGESLDVLFVSHVDIPHIDRDLVSYMRSDAYVVCPEEVTSFFDPILGRECTIVGMKIGEKRTIGPAVVEAYEGDDRRGTSMRCFLVTVDGTRVLQTGDQHYVAEWMRKLPGRNIDVLMIGPLEEESWVIEAINLIRPAVALPGAMYDMSHPKETWDGYPYAYELRDNSDPEVIPMFFGEMLRIKQTSSKSASPTIIVVVIVAIVGLSGLVLRTRGLNKGDGRRRQPPKTLKCEKRYVKKLCLTCKDYAIRGGHPFCSRYNFRLNSDD